MRGLRRALPVVAGLSVAWTASAAGLDPTAVREGAQLFREACAACHGEHGTGDGPAADALRTRPTDLTRLAARNAGTFPRDRVIEVIAGERPVTAHGSREMPVWCQRFAPSGSGATAAASIYARRNLERLATYLESIQHSGRP